MADSIDTCSSEYEKQRLHTLAKYQILDTRRESAFDEIVEIASIICEAPISVINFIDRDRQWFKAEKGLGLRETPLDVSICSHAILQPGLFIVPDTTRDPRFANNPLVTGEPYLRFYAGALLQSQDGYPLGTLRVLDHRPRELTERQRFALQALANQVMAHLELLMAHRAQADLLRELEITRKELGKLAATDSLTGLLNRRAFEERLNQELALIRRGAPAATLVMIDLDYFKTVNDTWGHQAGDKALVHFTELCREVFRQADVIGRWGGEEFVVMLPGSTVAESQHATERLHHLLASSPILDDVLPPVYITTSIGVCPLIGSSTMDECLLRADELLYQAKEQGRNRTVSEPDATGGSEGSGSS